LGSVANSISEIITDFAFATRLGFKIPYTRICVGLLGPCSKTGPFEAFYSTHTPPCDPTNRGHTRRCGLESSPLRR